MNKATLFRLISLVAAALLIAPDLSKGEEFERLPSNVHLALKSFFQCSRYEDIPTYSGDHFNYCGVDVAWPLASDGASQLHDCLRLDAIQSATKLPSFRRKGAIEYDVTLACPHDAFLSIEIDVLGSAVWIAGINEKFFEPL